MNPDQKKTVSGSADFRIVEVRRLEDLPPWTDASRLGLFLHESLKPYTDPVPDIGRGLRDAFAVRGGKQGFILLAETDAGLAGALVMHATGMKGYVPENLLLYVAVDPAWRGRGIGSRLILHAVSLCEGDIKLHVEHDNPARGLYERLGFTSKHAEMRLER